MKLLDPRVICSAGREKQVITGGIRNLRATGRVRPIANAVRFVAPWASVLLVSTALAYGLNIGLSACCSISSATVNMALDSKLPGSGPGTLIGVSVVDQTREELSETEYFAGAGVAEPPDRKAENRSDAFALQILTSTTSPASTKDRRPNSSIKWHSY
jgi:hypothetical protein